MPIRRLTLLVLAAALILGVLSYSTTLSALLFSLGLLTAFLLFYLSRFFTNPKEAQALFTPGPNDSFTDSAVTDPHGQQLISYQTYRQATRLLYQSLTALLLLLILTGVGLRTLPVPTALLVPIASLLFLLLLSISLYRFYSITPPNRRLPTLKALFTADKGRLFAKHAFKKDSGEVTVAYSTYKRLYKTTAVTLTALSLLLLIAVFSEVRATRLNTEHALTATGNQLNHVWQVIKGKKDGDVAEEVKRLLAQSVQVAPTLDESSLTRRILTQVTDNLPEPTTITSTNTVVEKNIIHSHTLETIKFEDNGYLSYQDENGTTFLTFGGSPKMTLEEAGILNIKGTWQIDGTEVTSTASELNSIDDIKDSPLLVLEADSDLNKERVLTAGTNLSLSDGGEGGAATLSLDLNGVTYTWPATNGTASQYLQTDGAGVLSWADVASGITIGDTVTSATEGSILFAGASSVLAQDNANFQWVDASNRLAVPEVRAVGAGGLKLYEDGGAGIFVEDGGQVGVGTTAPGAALEVASGDIVLRNSNGTNDAMKFWAGTNYGLLSIYTNASEVTRLRGNDRSWIGSGSGVKLGIADTNADAMIEIAENGTTPFMISDGAGGDGDFVIVTTSGNVGIADTTPAATLTVGDGDLFPVAGATGNITTAGALQIDGNTTLGSDGSDSITINADALTYASDTAVTLSGGVDGLNFDSGTLSIDAENNRVGIGTAAPTELLDVSDGTTNVTIDGRRLEFKNTGDSVFIGEGAGANDDLSTNRNIFIGLNAGAANTSGGNNIVVGRDWLKTNTTSSGSIAIGNQVLENSTAVQNIGIGTQVLRQNTTGAYNVAIGITAAYSNDTGIYNYAIGNAALFTNESGDYNTAIGSQTLYTTTGSKSTAIGYRSLRGAQNSNNTAFGYGAGDNITTGSNNLIIGYDIDAQSATASNQLSIGNLIFSEGIDGTGTTISSGNIGIGDTSPSQLLSVGNGDLFTVTSTGQADAGTAGDGLVTKINAGACDDTVFTTDTNGLLCIDSSNGRLYFRYGGAWHYSAQTAGFQIPNYETHHIKVGDMVVGRIDKRLSDGALHGLWETVTLDDLKDGVVDGSLVVHGDSHFLGDILVDGDGKFKGDLDVEGQFTRGNEQIGRATIPKNGTEVTVEFKQPFTDTPAVQVTSANTIVDYSTFTMSKTGFTIRTAEPVTANTTFTWTALLVTDIQETTGQAPESAPEPQTTTEPESTSSDEGEDSDSRESNTDTATNTKPKQKAKPTPTPSPIPSPTPTPTVAGTTDEAEPTTEPTEPEETEDTTDEPTTTPEPTPLTYYTYELQLAA